MASASVETAGGPLTGALLLERLAEHGSAAHPYAGGPALLKAPTAARDLADLVHYLCVLHGRYPGLIDHAASRVVEPEARNWLTNATYAFAGERAYLARLAVAAGPVPSTPGAGGTDAAVLGQRHAMETLACSERRGCALGAAMALVLDWAAIRFCLDSAAARLGIDSPAYPAADRDSVIRLADAHGASAPVQRALLFGAQQILVQHHGLWDLLEARQQARAAG
ncbi:MAG TPA: hypothetical protein VFR28_10485 [Allosphingosinicella sp.]|jgi:hypothetical protein|nr:hypothetical protein [Allosphingosinicella sp.]